MLVRYDPFRQLDRVTGDLFGSSPLPHPGTGCPWTPSATVTPSSSASTFPVCPDSVDVTVERKVLTVKAERSWSRGEGDEVLTRERPQGSVSRQVMLAETLDTDHLEAHFDGGVLTSPIPVAEQAKARKVEIQPPAAAHRGRPRLTPAPPTSRHPAATAHALRPAGPCRVAASRVRGPGAGSLAADGR